jgi:hypothetical protein
MGYERAIKEINRCSYEQKQRLMLELNSQLNDPTQKTRTKVASVEEFTDRDWISMHEQSGQELLKRGVQILTESDVMVAELQVRRAEEIMKSSVSTVALVLTRILDARQGSKSHAKRKQAEQLRYAIEYIGKFETGGRLDEQLELTAGWAKWNVDWVAQLYQVLGYAREPDISEAGLADAKEVLMIAQEFKDAVKKLLDDDDQGQALIATVDTYQGEIQRLRGDAMAAAAVPDYGGRPSLDWLRTRWAEYKQDHQDWKPRQVYEAIRHELTTYSNKDGFKPKPNLPDEQKRAAESLISSRALTEFPKYYYELFSEK